MTLEFSRENPPRTLIPVNVNHLGAQNVLMPTEYKPSSNRMRRKLKPLIHERETTYENFNETKPTPLHPPYESLPQASEIIQGTGYQQAWFPIVF